MFCFRVDKSKYFRREGADVHTDAFISLSQSILGGTIRVQGVYDDQTIQIMPGTSSHTRICLNNKGLKRVNSFGTGHHYVNIKIQVPTKLNEKQKALIQAYAELEDNTPGQILGVTFKTDGKSTSDNTSSSSSKSTKSSDEENISKKFTQGSFEDDNYKETDSTSTHAYRKELLDSRYYYSLGVCIVFIAFIIYSYNNMGSYLDDERNKVLFENERIKREGKSPFSDA